MNDRSSRSSQVGLFSEQISEQIGRLRVLTGSDADRADGVALKRAVMATRLLAGSARVLHVDELVSFLDELLAWLQWIGEAGRRATPTQSIILDAVVSFEESLMRQLERKDEVEDFSSFSGEISELRGLIRKNREKLMGMGLSSAGEASDPEVAPEVPPETAPEVPTKPPVAPSETEAPPEPVAPPEAETPSEPVAPSETEAPPELVAPPETETPPEPLEMQIVEAMGTLADWLDGLDLQHGEELAAQEEALSRLRHLHSALEHLLKNQPSMETEGESQEAAASSIASNHPLVLQLARSIETHADVFQGHFEYHIEGDPGEFDSHRVELLGRVLDHLVDDARDILEEMVHEEDAPPLAQLSVVFRTENNRLRIAIEDNGPTPGASPMLDHADPLGLYRGLRRSRSLIEELHGIILVEPEDRPGTRFVLSLPRDVSRPLVRIFDLGRVEAAISDFLVDEVISTEGLLFHRETDGEHFMRNGRPVPLVDLAEYLSGLEPLAEEAREIVIVGSVEKRLGIYCNGIAEAVEAHSTEESLPQWGEVSRQTVHLQGKDLPLLSVKRLLELRMTIQLIEEPGSVQDPVLDAYIPSSDEAEFEPEAEPSGNHVLLVNQSEFRLRELKGMLEEAGFSVTTACDLTEGLEILRAEPADLVVTDLRLGDRAAVGLPDLHRTRPQLRVILTSSVAREYAEELARHAGADACWLQPYRLDDLLKILQLPR